MMKPRLHIFAVLLVTFSLESIASNLCITNVHLQSIGTGRAVAIQLDLSWENAWMDEFNHDAVWLFAKYSLDGGTNWHHATLRDAGTNPAVYDPGSDPDIEIYVPEDGKGAFVRPQKEMARTIDTKGLQLIWDLRADEVEWTSRGRVAVHGIEMVYIPQGPFYLGEDLAQAQYSGHNVTWINTSDIAKTTASAGSGTIAAPHVNPAGLGRPTNVAGSFTNAFPNGYNAYYIMKHELTRGSYITFLNMLTENQATNLYAAQKTLNGTSGTINGAYPNYSVAHPWRALQFNTGDAPTFSGSREFFAYLDWAALRPMTEFEYEKACRGPMKPILGDYAWGNAAAPLVTGVADPNTPAETPPKYALLVAGVQYYSLLNNHPLRNGFATDAGSDQFLSGASYYGVLEMTGNAGERCVAVTHADGRAYSGLHGDGALNTDGTANVPNWPYQTATSYGGGSLSTRGGNIEHDPLKCTVSARPQIDNYYPAVKHGIRGVRSVH